ncbi:MAG TPA: response regulator transcription factor [Planktothrix sp.]|jgi:DNA-binding response OmpR family regulator
MPRLLVVEDDPALCEMVCLSVRAQSFDVDNCNNGEDALDFIALNPYALLILDWNLPGISGLDILKRYRKNGGDAPVLFLTAREDIMDKEEGFAAGADDYLTKPFLVRELLARVRALLRRHKAVTQELLRHLDLTLDPKTYSLKRKEESISLSRKEFELLFFFMTHPNEVFSAQHLASELADDDAEGGDQYARIMIKRLREAIDVVGEESYIKNVRGHGYGLREKI